VSGFRYEITRRIATVRDNLAEAVATDDPFGVDVHIGELESLARLAADHGVAVDGLHEALTRHGVDVTVSTQSPTTAPIDLSQR
jgi:hypothetical protein